jgi:CSLREA domain-containing protein
MASSLSRRKLVLQPLESRDVPAIFNVTSLSDGGAGSLRQAILDANASPGADTITFTVTGTIMLSGTQLPMLTDTTGSTTITGPGANLLTVNGMEKSRAFLVPFGVTASISGMTISACKGGGTGGGILNFGTLTVANSTVSGCGATVGGGIYSYGELTVANSTISGNFALGNSSFYGEGEGGGIYSKGTLNVTGSTISGNLSGNPNSGVGLGVKGIGGAIAGFGVVTVTNSTITGNSVSSATGLSGAGIGGGIYTAGTLTVSNSTIISNSAALGGGISFAGSAPVLTVTSSIVSSNFAGFLGPDILNSTYPSPGATATINNSAIGSNKGFTLSGGNNLPFGTNLELGPLGNYGGLTQTIPLLPGSPALNAGGSTTLTLDQRGQPRNAAGGVDIGAFESQGFTLAVQSGSPQATLAGTAFSAPLALTVTAVNAMEPVNGGTVAFTAPGSGASATPQTQTVTISAGAATSGTLTANGTVGAYNVTASVVNASMNFALTNTETPSLIVTTSSDVVSNIDGLTSLREAINYANSHPGADAITFDASFNSATTITLSGTELPALTDKSGATTIVGPGANMLTISGNNLSRVFEVASGVTASISGVTISAGRNVLGMGNGGGIYSLGTLTVTNSTLSADSASHAGGAIFTAGSGNLTVANSTLSGNSAALGGGIYCASSVTVVNSTFSGNTAGTGGSIFNNYGTLNVDNSTLASNSAVLAGGILNRSNGAIGSLTVASSIVSGNSGGAGPDIYNSGTGTGADTISFSAIGSSAGFTMTGSSNLAFGANLKLGPLANNGGPTQTLLPANDSPLVDAGSNPQNLTTDQRGMPRVAGSHADIGAVELPQEPQSLIVTTADDDVNPFDFKTSLREAINYANSHPGADTITFDPSFNTATTITLSGTELPALTDKSGATTIVGPGANLLTISGNKISRVFEVAQGVTATISGVTISGGSAAGSGTAGNGGGIFTAGTLTVTNSAVSGNSAVSFGGGIYSITGTLTVTNSTISNNTCKDAGGVAVNGPMSVTNSTFFGNTSIAGGGILLATGPLTLTNSTVSGNSATVGGGIYVSSGSLTLTSTIVSGNTAGTGPDIKSNSTATINNSAIGSSAGFTMTGSNNLAFGTNLRLGPLGNYGGPTQTIPLLPGSPVINAGASTTVTLDQRGQPRNAAGGVDIGAFESQGFTVAVQAGSPQTSVVNLAFLKPLVASVTAVNAIEPVDGGIVTFTAPGSGAMASPQTQSITVSAGTATSGTLTANGTAGSYNVAASVAGSSVNFALTNLLVEAPSLIVTTNSDVVANDNYTSLREAINYANSHPGADTITFDSSFNSATTITLNGNQLALTDTSGAITIVGPGANLLTISGNQLNRVFQVASGVTASISGVTITGGLTASSGGGIMNSGTLTLTGVALNGNSANIKGGGVYSLAPLIVTNCSLTNNTANGQSGGGGIYSASGVMITDSSLSGNSAQVGGGIAGGAMMLTGVSFSGNLAISGAGIYNFAGNVTVNNSTFSGNSASSFGGGIGNFNHSTLTLNNSTFSGNSAAQQGGGLYNDSTSTAALTNLTMSANSATGGLGGGIMSVAGGSLTVTNTLLAANKAVGGNDVFGAATMTFCMLSDTAGVVFSAGSGNNITSTNPRLGTLGNYGGPTQTIPLLFASPAINAGGSTTLTTDQRGQPRNAAGGVDIGAFESQGFTVNVVSGSPQITVFNTAFAVPLTVGLTAKNAVEPVGDATVTFNAPASGPSAALSGSTVAISGGQASVTATANSTGGSYNVTATVNGSASVTFALTNGDAASLASLVVTTNSDTSTLFDGLTSLREALAYATSKPGAATITFDPGVFATAQTITLNTQLPALADSSGITITGPGANLLTIDGNKLGRVFEIAAGATASISGLTISGGNAVDGGIVNYGTLSLTNATISGNSASGGSTPIGGILNGGTLTLTNSTVSGNSASGGTSFSIGGIFSASGTVTLTNSTVNGNSASGGSAVGGIFNGGTLTLTNSTVSGNSANGGISFAVGGIFGESGTVTLTNSTVSGNSASGGSNDSIGGIFNFGTLTLTNSTVSGNSASGGSTSVAGIGSQSGTVTLTNSTVSGNSANGGGSGFYIGGIEGAGTITLTNCTVSGNSASGGGSGGSGNSFGGIVSFNGTLTLTNSTVCGNSANVGGVAVSGSAATVTNSIVATNTGTFIPIAGYALNNLLGTATVTFSLLGDTTGTTFAAGSGNNIISSTPLLGVLGNNGGPTQTIALLPGSPAINAGTATGAPLTDQRGRPRVGNVDIGAYEVQPPAKVSNVVVGDGTAQRSIVNQIKVTFDSPVVFIGSPASAFTLFRQSDSKAVTLVASVDPTDTIVTLTFTGGAVNGTSLADGRYTLKVLANQIGADGLDGNSDGIGGDDFVEVGAPGSGHNLFRLYGDVNGDGTVSASDFIQFRQFFGGYLFAFDFDGDGSVAASDFIQFRLRFGGSI